MDIEEDEEPGWYICQCIAGTETNVMAQLKAVVPKTPGAMSSIERFHVPTRLAGNSRMSKVFTSEQVLYPSYIFVNMKLNSLTYTAIRSVSRVSSFVGTRKPIGRGSLSMVVPRRLSPEEVSRFEGLVKSGSVTSQKDAKAFEYDIGDMVKVIKGEMKGETGAVRQVRDGNLVIRFWTYGSQLDVYFSPDDVRKLTREEVEKGLDGPTTPLGQDDIDVALGRTPRRRREEQGAPTRREDDNLRVKGSRDTRNRRVDREQRGERERNWVDPVTERENWDSYKRKEARKNDGEKRTADWEIFQGMSSKGDTAAVEKTEEEKMDEDDFFKDLMEELNESLNDDAPPASPGGSSEVAAHQSSEPASSSDEGHGDLSKLTVPLLKDICRQKGLKVGGTKKDLIERISN
ncbi:hypothetical protein TrVE_jg10368 [Triparma verrucosa]|uniref:50S ribosomal protein L24, chloroplastic n=1 Tax=Triparma verrucosa TaxID=1606542 RepID=A0A9W7FHT2_9STRA|nr:hypothetical protein TrVE_jg10368 [Triparma verrucosa]